MTLSPLETNDVWMRSGAKKQKQGILQAFIRAFVGGVMLSLGGLLYLILNAGDAALTTSNPGLTKLINAAVFPIGLIMIMLHGADLATSNMAIFAMTVIKKRTPVWSYPLHVGVSFLGNFAGALWVAGIFGKYSGLVSDDPYLSYIISFAHKKAVVPTWSMILVRGIGCNFLVSVAVWQGTMATEVISKVVGIHLPVFLFVACGFDHVIANALFLPLALMLGKPFSVGYYIWKSIIPSFIGNCLGALLFVLPLLYLHRPSDHLPQQTVPEVSEIIHTSASSVRDDMEKKV
ncbi:Formate/nitrite transporter [Meredithblackwellia eburnea MCA 4105]